MCLSYFPLIKVLLDLNKRCCTIHIFCICGHVKSHTHTLQSFWILPIFNIFLLLMWMSILTPFSTLLSFFLSYFLLSPAVHVPPHIIHTDKTVWTEYKHSSRPYPVKLLIFQFEVLRTVKQCSVVVGYHRFRGPCCFHLQGEVIFRFRVKYFPIRRDNFTLVFILYFWGKRNCAINMGLHVIEVML